MSNLIAPAGRLSSGASSSPAWTVPWTSIDPADITAAAVAALVATSPIAGTFTLTGPHALTFDALAADLSSGLEREITWLEVRNAAWRTALAEAGLPRVQRAAARREFASISARPYPPLTETS